MQSQISAYEHLFSLDLPVKVKFALLVLLDLANQRSASISDMASKNLISKPYLEWICGNLQRGGLIDSCQVQVAYSHFDAEKTYALKRQPTQITLLDVVRAMENQADYSMSFDAYTPDRKLIHQIWQKARTAAQNTLDKYTLQDLCQKQSSYDFP